MFVVTQVFQRCARGGFTLSEVLIALALLGVIAAFTIPKVITALNNAHRDAVFKETVFELEALVVQGVQNGKLSYSTHPQYFYDNLNTLKICDSSALAQGCFTQSGGVHSFGDERAYAGLIMPNGVTVAGFQTADVIWGSGGRFFDGVVLDWNGVKPPNQFGKDQLEIALGIGPKGSIFFNGKSYRVPGVTASDTVVEPNSEALWRDIFGYGN